MDMDSAHYEEEWTVYANGLGKIRAPNSAYWKGVCSKDEALARARETCRRVAWMGNEVAVTAERNDGTLFVFKSKTSGLTWEMVEYSPDDYDSD